MKEKKRKGKKMKEIGKERIKSRKEGSHTILQIIY